MAIGAFPFDQCFPNKTLSPISKASLSNHLLSQENQTKIPASHEKYTLTLQATISQNGQTHSNDSSANYRRIVGVCLTILWDWCLNG